MRNRSLIVLAASATLALSALACGGDDRSEKVTGSPVTATTGNAGPYITPDMRSGSTAEAARERDARAAEGADGTATAGASESRESDEETGTALTGTAAGSPEVPQ
jgi:hypothetical protein